MQYLLKFILGQWMPAQRQDHGEDCDQYGKPREEDTDLCCLAGHNHIGGKTLKNILKLTGACGNVILSTRGVRNLLQRFFVDLSSETASAAKVATSAAKRRIL